MKILLAGHIRYFSKLVVAALCMATVNIVYAEGSPLTSEDKAIADMAKDIRAKSGALEIPQNIHSQQADKEARQFFSTLKEKTPELFGQKKDSKPSGRIIFFASHSLGREGLEDLLYTASITPESMVVFRGIRDIDNFAASVFEIQKLAATQLPMAKVVLDPTLFRDYGVTKVPTIIYLDEDKQSEIARVSGLAQPNWLVSKVESGKGGDFGARGPVEDILERDLIEVMQEKVAAIDWAEKKENAIKRFWDKQQFIDLIRARKLRTRYLDPSIVMSDDLRDADGNVLVARGTVINPLELRPFTQAVVVFDPLDHKQIGLVEQRLADLAKTYPRVTLVVTQFDRAEGWDSYKSITNHFDAPVFKLTPDLLSRFELEYVPSIITAEQNYFVIEELAVVEEEIAE
ncbi:MAG: conjugal transfer protein TraW [gamma proteobacterium symbiont of Clathrolucina costata]